MIIPYIYIKYDEDLHALAKYLRSKLNIPETNSSFIEQYRFGVNRGGEYYLFEALGLELMLLKNKGEVLESDYKEYPYYLIIESQINTDDKVFRSIAYFLGEVLKSNKLIIQIEFI